MTGDDGTPARAGASLPLRREVARKAVHLTSALFPVSYALGLPRALLLAALLACVVFALGVETARARWAPARRHFDRWLGALLRERERVAWCGATWMLIAYLIAVALFPRAEAIVAMWAVSVGDASAALVGRTVGHMRLHPGGKSLEGTVACALATALGAYALARLDLPTAIVAGVVAALAEWPGRPLDDNLRITLLTGVSIVLWRLAFLDKMSG